MHPVTRLAAATLIAVAAIHAATSVSLAAGVAVDSIFAEFRPFVIEVVSVLIAALLAVVLKKLHAWLGISIEAKHRQALQSALENGAKLALGKAEKAIDGARIPLGSPTLEAGVGYVLNSVPDAVSHFGLTPERVAELLRPKLIAPVFPPAPAAPAGAATDAGRVEMSGRAG